MILRVVPLRRLPHGLTFFDYVCDADIPVGAIVAIKFRATRNLAIVWELRTDSDFKGSLKPIDEIVVPFSLLDNASLSLAEWISNVYHTPLGVVLPMFLPPLQRRMLAKIQERPSQNVPACVVPTELYTYETEHDLAEIFKGITHESLCVLVPLHSDIDRIKKWFPKFLVFESDTKVSGQRNVWTEVFQGTFSVIVGTRSACMLPFPKNTTFVLLDEEQEGHKQWDGAPLYRVHDVLARRVGLMGGRVVYISRAPQVATLLSVESTHRHVTPLARIGERWHYANMTHERLSKNFGVFADAVKNELAAHADKKILIICNRKGYANIIECPQCGAVTTCATCGLPLLIERDMLRCRFCAENKTMSDDCEKCGSPSVKFKSIGIEMIAEELEKITGFRAPLFDATTDASIISTADSLVATDAILPHLNEFKPDLIVFPCADRELNIPEYFAEEKTMSRYMNVRGYTAAHPDTQVWIQTYTPTHPVFSAIRGGTLGAWYAKEKKLREVMNLPPYFKLVKVILESPTAKKDAEALAKQMEDASAYPRVPEQEHGTARYVVLIKLAVNGWEDEVRRITASLPPYAKVDVNPISMI